MNDNFMDDTAQKQHTNMTNDENIVRVLMITSLFAAPIMYYIDKVYASVILSM